MRKSRLYILGLVTLVLFPLIGITIIGFVEDNPWAYEIPFQLGWHFQTIIGLVFGVLAGFLAWRMIRLPFMTPVRAKYGVLIHQLGLSTFDIFFISFCAGVGEELLFRGALQTYLGIWPTAIFFVAIHGYLNPMDWRISVYGILMTLIIAILGYFTADFGILTSIVAHFAIDVVLLFYLTKSNPDETD
ncbi:MAG: CPBP family intramembrane metalloprotease [Crocinitomicaceae bacterium]|nr:CPBP family intramembrane metalloprotease [Crocinitomicaceae bacterium]